MSSDGVGMPGLSEKQTEPQLRPDLILQRVLSFSERSEAADDMALVVMDILQQS